MLTFIPGVSETTPHVNDVFSGAADFPIPARLKIEQIKGFSNQKGLPVEPPNGRLQSITPL